MVIAAYSDDRWADLLEAVESAQRQPSRPEVVVAVDNNPSLLDRVRSQIPGVVTAANTGPRGASGARNAGVAASSSDIVAFLDDDAVASPDWLERLLRPFADPAVLGVGGRIVPLWETPVPRWFSGELGWVIGATDHCMPTAASRVRNVWTGNMAVRRTAFDAVDGFRVGYGLVGGRPWPEDTEFCLRVGRAHRGGHWYFEPSATVGHKVPSQRARLGYFLARCWYQGRTKPEMAAFLAESRALSSERAYVMRVLPAAAARGIIQAGSAGDWTGMARAGVIIASMGSSAAGLVLGYAATRLQPARQALPVARV